MNATSTWLIRRIAPTKGWRENIHLHRKGAGDQAEEPAGIQRRVRQGGGRVCQSRRSKKRIRERLESERQHAAEHSAKDELVEELVKRNEFEVPEALVERQIDLRLERGLRALAAQGTKARGHKEDGPGPASRRAARAGGAGSEVRPCCSKEVADEEKIEVRDEELNQRD